MGYLERLDGLARADVAGLHKAQLSYGDSWKRRGGANAFFMLVRKMDRIEIQVAKHANDIFAAALADQRVEGIADDIRDLRRYLLLVEAEIEDLKQRAPVSEQATVDLTEPESP